MPFPVARPSAYEELPLTFEEREKIRLWIQGLAKGSSLPECGGCGSLPDAGGGARDGGARDGAATDSGATDAADAGATDAADQ